MNGFWKKWSDISLIVRIVIGLVVGITLGIVIPNIGVIIFLGTFFVTALKAVAPILVFFLVMSALAQHEKGKNTNMGYIIFLYLLSTFIAALVAVFASFLFPTTLMLEGAGDISAAPGGITEVFSTLLLNIVDNPVSALYNANYIGILAAALLLGLALKDAQGATKTAIADISNAISKIVAWIIQLAPFGIMGLVYSTVSAGGVSELANYVHIVVVLVGCMAFVAFVTNPIIVYLNTKKNPYPLVLKCLRDSGLTAFFTRSSAANIPVNMRLCEELGLNRDTYAVSIPLGSTINMAGAAITINVITLAGAHTLGIDVSFFSAFILSVVASLSACGASGVAGGSLLLIPLACSLFGIPADISAQLVGVGFVVGVIQDSCETGLNSSTDVLLTATADIRDRLKKGIDVKM